jgi:hypothetical protein
LIQCADYTSFALEGGAIAVRSPRPHFITRIRGARLGTLSGLLACGLLLAVVQPAAAQPVERSHERVMETFQDVVCDIPVTITVDIINNIQERLAKSGFALFQTTGPGTTTITNPVTGKSVVTRFTGAVKA